MLIAHISICLDCFPFYLLRKCSLFCVLKKKCELYNSISESHHCNISDVYILIFFFYRELAMTVLAMKCCHHSPPCPLQISWICSICDLPPSPYLAMTENFRETTLPMNNHCDSEIFVNTRFFVVKHTYIPYV